MALGDWHWLSMMFNRVNRAMGQGDLYPFTLTPPVVEKLAFVHRLVSTASRPDTMPAHGRGPDGWAVTGVRPRGEVSKLRPEAVDAFDALVSRTLAGIEGENGTLLYFTSRVADAPLFRVFVEVYADEAAFAAHEAHSHTRLFLEERECR